MTLARQMGQGMLLVGISNSSISVGNVDVGGTGEAVGAALDFGVVDGLQLGLFLDFPVHPNADIDTFAVNGQYALTEFVNGRLDLGMQRIISSTTVLGRTITSSATGFAFGLGLPFKWRFSDQLAFVSGRPAAFAFGSPLQLVSSTSSGAGASSGLGILLTDDIFAMSIFDHAKIGALSLPVGLLAQVHPNVALELRAGYRLAFIIPETGDTQTESFVPLALDVLVSPVSFLDFGFTFELPGDVDSSTIGYADLRQFLIFVQGRF
jgi:hypothetical protein